MDKDKPPEAEPEPASKTEPTGRGMEMPVRPAPVVGPSFTASFAFLGAVAGLVCGFQLMVDWGNKFGAAGGGDGAAGLEFLPCCCGLPLVVVGFVVGRTTGAWLDGKFGA